MRPIRKLEESSVLETQTLRSVLFSKQPPTPVRFTLQMKLADSGGIEPHTLRCYLLSKQAPEPTGHYPNIWRVTLSRGLADERHVNAAHTHHPADNCCGECDFT